MIALEVRAPRAPRPIIPPGSVVPRDNRLHPGGRPPKLDQELSDQILEYVEEGNYLEEAAALAGVEDQTIREWEDRARDEPSGPFGQFSRALKRARAEAQRNRLLDITHRRDNWQASAWFKERTSRRLWGRPVPVEDLGEDGTSEPIEIRVRVVQSRPANVLDVDGTSRITEGEGNGGDGGARAPSQPAAG